MKVFENLLKSEVAKVEKFATTINGKKTQITGYSTDMKIDALGFLTVICEMCSDNMSVREKDVVLNVFMPDRRKSFVSVT